MKSPRGKPLRHRDLLWTVLTALGQYKDPAAISVEFTEVLGLEQSTKLVQGRTRVIQGSTSPLIPAPGTSYLALIANSTKTDLRENPQLRNPSDESMGECHRRVQPTVGDPIPWPGDPEP